MRTRLLVLGLLLIAPLAVPAAPGPTAVAASPVWSPFDGVAAHEPPPEPHVLPPDSTDVPATPVEGVYRVTVLMDPASWDAHADPVQWALDRFAVVSGYFDADHDIRFAVCRVARFNYGLSGEYTQVRHHALIQAPEYDDADRLHTTVPQVDTLGGDCAGALSPLGGPPSVDLLVVFLGRDLTCNGVAVGGCAEVLGGFSMNVDYAARYPWAYAWGTHASEHILQHELSHNFGALDNECQYGIMDYDHTYSSHDWCTRDEVRMTVGKHLVRANALGTDVP